jgi:aminobenzoyl-glutamate utilization protein B
MLDIAQGAALMSGTTHDIEFITGCYDLLPNDTLSDLLLAKMQEVNDLKFTDQERAFAKELQETFPTGSVQRGFEWMQRSANGGIADGDIDNPLWEQVLPHSSTPPLMGGSTEVGDVSWITPTDNSRRRAGPWAHRDTVGKRWCHLDRVSAARGCCWRPRVWRWRAGIC